MPLLLAALAPQMLRLAGSLADGTVLWMTGPATVRDYIVPSITRAAQEAGRPSPRVVCVLPVCVTDDPEQARVDAGKAFAIYGQLPSYRAMLDREGAAGPGDVAIVGDEDAVAAQIRALAEAGVTDFVAGEYARGADRPADQGVPPKAHRRAPASGPGSGTCARAAHRNRAGRPAPTGPGIRSDAWPSVRSSAIGRGSTRTQVTPSGASIARSALGQAISTAATAPASSGATPPR